MALGDRGIIFVGTRKAGKVYGLVDNDKNHRADEVTTIAKGLNMPNGVAFHNGSLYVAEVNKISRYDRIEKHIDNPPAPVIVNDTFPTERHHGWKYIRFGPNAKIWKMKAPRSMRSRAVVTLPWSPIPRPRLNQVSRLWLPRLECRRPFHARVLADRAVPWSGRRKYQPPP